MTLAEKQLIVSLLQIEGIGCQTVRKVLKHFPAMTDVMSVWQELVARGEQFDLSTGQAEKLKLLHNGFEPQQYWESLQKQDCSLIFEDDPHYPSQLKPLTDKPLLLFVKGAAALWQKPCVGVVGTRQITSYGKLVTTKVVKDLVLCEAVIVSGFMYGVDVWAHRVADEVGGQSIGVLGFGFGHMYPRSQSRLLEELLSRGHCFVTEYPPCLPPTKGTFVARNRLIAALSLGVIVTEAAQKSGSHITAAWALEYGKSVFAVPGPVTNPYSEGTKWLINEGAKLVTSGYEVATELGLQHVEVAAQSPGEDATLTPKMSILRELKNSSLSLEALLVCTHLSLSELLTNLTLLELEGLVIQEGEVWSVTAACT